MLSCGCIAAALGDDGYVGRRLVSQKGNVSDSVGYEPPPSSYERKNSSGCDVSSLRLNTSNLKDTDSFSEVKLENLSGDLAVETKWRTPLLTFCRRYKRKKEMDESDIHSKSLTVENNYSVITKSNNYACANTTSCEAISLESFSLDHGADLNPCREVCDMSIL